MNTLKKRIIQICALLLVAASLFSFAGCGGGKVRVHSVQVNNSTFFEDMFREWYFADQKLEPGTEFYEIACAFSGTYAKFEEDYFRHYDANLGMECELEVTNKTGETITATGLDVGNNHYKYTHVSSRLGYCKDVGIPAGESRIVTFLFLGNGGLYTNEEFINEIFPQMPMELIYTTSAGETMTAPVKFEKVKVVY